MKKNIILLFLLSCYIITFAQPAERMIRVQVTPDSENWNYVLGNKARFDVCVTKSNVLLDNVEARYELSYDMMPPFKVETIRLKNGKFSINGDTMKNPGFLRCKVFVMYDGTEYAGIATAGYDPQSIKPTVEMPEDFITFWEEAKTGNKKIPLDPRLRLLPEKSTSKADVYELSIQNYRKGSWIYGILSVPKKEGKFPALLRVPGAGVRPYNGNVSAAEDGVITLEIGIHGIPVTMEQYVYNELRYGALNGYQFNNWDNRDETYYKRVYLGCIRAVDYIFSMDKFDGENVVVYGGSQGGALSLVVSALDERIKRAVIFYPALADLTGYLHNRAGGWPHLFRDNKQDKCITEQKVKTTQYYDVVNFARLIKIPVFYSFGYNDMVCPPTSTFSAYNVISSPKTLYIVPEIGHYTYPEMWKKASEFCAPVLGRQIKMQ